MGGTVSLPPNFHENIYFSSIYSHALTLDKQKDKMFSLEAMNDLRTHTDRRFSTRATLTALKAPVSDVLGLENSYYRRAVRRNELFFVVQIKDVYDEEKIGLLMRLGNKNEE